MATYARKLSKGIKYFYKFDLNGKTYRSQCIYLTKQDAKKGERDKFKELEQGELTDIRLDYLIKERLDYIKTKKSAHYHRNTERYLKLFRDEFGNIEIKSITKGQINRFLLNRSKELNSDGKDNYAVNALYRQIRALFNHAINLMDANIKNPCIGISLFSVKKKLKYIPTDKDIEAVLGICNDEQALLINFVMETGSRIGEAIRFTFEDMANDYIVLYTRKSRNSNLTPRKLPKPKCLGDLQGKGKVFSWTDKPKFLQLKVKKLGLKMWGWHSLRHRYASLLSKSNTPIFDIMSKLGHTSISTTQIYLQLLED